MYSEWFGTRINLIYIAILVAIYDLVHIAYELKERFHLFWFYEDTEDGCLDDLFQTHCKFIYTEVSIYILDFIFTGFLIYGASRVREILQKNIEFEVFNNFQLKTIPVLAWIILSAYHLVDFFIIFTPLFGTSYPLAYITQMMWLDLGQSDVSKSKQIL